MRIHNRSRTAVPPALALTFALLLALPSALVAAQDGDGVRRAIGVQERISARLMANPAVVGTGVGLNAAGKATIRVYTTKAGVAGLPREADGVPVQRVVTGLITAQACQDTGDPRQRCNRPVPIGVSVGHPKITAGTIGARVRDANDNVYALSNNHVLANTNDASVGDSALQPGPYDGGTDPADRIGTLHDWQPISFSSNNTIDAAIALTTTGQLGTATLSAGYGIPKAATSNASVNLAVKKCGRTTGCTNGQVAEVNVTVDVCYKPQGLFCARNGVARFVNQFSVSPGTFSAGGDSGSLIVTNSGSNPVGLLFAGSSTRTFANPINDVLQRFGVTIDDRSGTSEPPPEEPPVAGAPSNLTTSVKPQGAVKVDLSWTGGASTVTVQRKNPGASSFAVIATINNSGSYRDNLAKNAPSGTYTYRVCNSGTTTCSNEALATVP
jgi:hypothetical protein